MCLPCCWPFTDLWLEDPPKETEKEKEKKEDNPVIIVPSGWHPQTQTPVSFPALAFPTVPEPPKEPAKKEGLQVRRYQPNYDNPQPAPPAAQPTIQPAMQYQYAGQLLIPFSQIATGSYAYAPFITPAQVIAPALAPAPAPAPAPSDPYIYQGATKSEVDARNASIAQANGSNKPTMLVPYKATATQDWWVRELDGSWTLRNTNTIQDALQPGYWCYGEGGVPCFVRTEKAK